MKLQRSWIVWMVIVDTVIAIAVATWWFGFRTA
jgi:hypothetical protein